MIIRRADMTDIPELIEMAETFINESGYAIEYSEDNSRNIFGLYVQQPSYDILIGKDEGNLTGGVMVVASTEFQARPFGYVSKFFVKPEHRDARTSRALMSAMMEWFAVFDVSHVFVTAIAGLSERDQRAFILLMKRAGFKEEGPVMYLER